MFNTGTGGVTTPAKRFLTDSSSSLVLNLLSSISTLWVEEWGDVCCCWCCCLLCHPDTNSQTTNHQKHYLYNGNAPRYRWVRLWLLLMWYRLYTLVLTVYYWFNVIWTYYTHVSTVLAPRKALCGLVGYSVLWVLVTSQFYRSVEDINKSISLQFAALCIITITLKSPS